MDISTLRHLSETLETNLCGGDIVFSAMRAEYDRISQLVSDQHQLQKVYLQIGTDGVVTTQLSVDAKVMPRGYFHPGPLYEWMVGGVSRGKLIRSIRRKDGVYSAHGFDCNGNIIVTTKYRIDWNNRAFEQERVMHMQDASIGVCCTTDDMVAFRSILETVYSGNKVKTVVEFDSMRRMFVQHYWYDEHGCTHCGYYHYEPERYSSEEIALLCASRFNKVPPKMNHKNYDVRDMDINRVVSENGKIARLERFYSMRTWIHDYTVEYVIKCTEGGDALVTNVDFKNHLLQTKLLNWREAQRHNFKTGDGSLS